MYVTKNHHKVNKNKKKIPKKKVQASFTPIMKILSIKTWLDYKNHRKSVLMNNSKFCKFLFCYLHLFEKKKTAELC